jgi:hypothetical protein
MFIYDLLLLLLFGNIFFPWWFKVTLQNCVQRNNELYSIIEWDTLLTSIPTMRDPVSEMRKLVGIIKHTYLFT